MSKNPNYDNYKEFLFSNFPIKGGIKAPKDLEVFRTALLPHDGFSNKSEYKAVRWHIVINNNRILSFIEDNFNIMTQKDEPKKHELEQYDNFRPTYFLFTKVHSEGVSFDNLKWFSEPKEVSGFKELPRYAQKYLLESKEVASYTLWKYPRIEVSDVFNKEENIQISKNNSELNSEILSNVKDDTLNANW